MRGQADWPNLDSLSIKLRTVDLWDLTAAEVGILYTMVSAIAGQCVNTYSEANPDPRLPGDPVKLARLAKCSVRQWKNFRPLMERHFSLSDGHWRLKDGDMIVISRPMTRNALSTSAKAVAISTGRSITTTFSRCLVVGSDEATNLVLACMPCNMSKGSKTLAEWVGR